VKRYDMQSYWTKVHELDRESTVDELSLVTHFDLPLYHNKLYDHLECRAWEQAWKRTGIPKCGTCVEIGPGRGRWTARITDRGLQVVGVDISPRAVELLRSKFPAERFEVGSAADLPAADGAVDLVSSVVVLLHLPPPEKSRAIAEIGRVLRSGGHALILESIHVGDRAPHVFPLSAEAWIEEFAEAGLDCVSVEGQEFVPLIRFVEAVERESKERPGLLKRNLRRLVTRSPVRRLTVGASYLVEPFAARLMPQQHARHGLFVFRKR